MSLTAVPYVCPSGQMILLHVVDQDGDPQIITDYAPDAASVVTVNGASGNFQIEVTVNGSSHATANIPLGSTSATLETAIQALPNVGAGNATVSGNNPYRIASAGDLEGTPFTLAVLTSGVTQNATVNPLTAGTTTEIDQDASGGNFSVVGSGWARAQAVQGTGYEAVASGAGVNFCSWTIPGLATGNYKVYYSFLGDQATVNGATTVPYRFYDGSTYRGKVVVDQTRYAGSVTLPGFDDPSLVSQIVGTVYVSGGSLTVVLSDDVEAGDVGRVIAANYISVVPTDPTAYVLVDDEEHGGQVATFVGSWGPYPEGWNRHDTSSDVPGSTCTWSFTGLVPGTYSVQVYYVAYTNRTTTASYAVYDGANQVGSTVVVDQQVATSGGLTETDLNGNAFTFTPLGNFAVAGPTLNLVLTASGSGYAIADAALVELVSASGYSEAVGSDVVVFSSGNPSASVNGGVAMPLSSFIWGVEATPCPYVLFPMANQVQPSDSVTVTLSANVISTAAGLVPGLSAVAAINKTGNRFVPDPPNERTMGVGWNPLLPGQGVIPFYSNTFKSVYALPYGGGNPPLTPDGYPTFTTAASPGYPIGAPPTNPIDPRGFPAYPASGVTTVMWDGAVAGRVYVYPDAGAVVTFVGENTGHATDNYVQFTIENGPDSTSYTPVFNFQFLGLIDFLDDADPGRTSSTGAWTAQTGSGWNSTYARNDKSPSSTFTWSLGDLPPGEWDFHATWVVSAGNTKTATYTVRQGGVTLAAFAVDQSGGNQGGGSNRDYNGVEIPFGTGIPFTATGGLITVTLSGGSDGYAVADCIWVQVVGSLATPFTPVTNARLYDPEVPDPLTSPPKFHPRILSVLNGSKSLRSLALLNALGSSVIDYSDFSTGTEFCCNLQGKSRVYEITKFENWGDPNGVWQQTNSGQTAKLTLSPVGGAPLPLVSGTVISSSSEPTMVVPTTNGTTDFQGFTGVVEYDPTRMTTNQIAVSGYGTTGTGPIVATTPVAPATSLGTVTVTFFSIPPADYFELVSLLEGCSAWVNVPKLASESCVKSLMDAAVEYLPAGTPVRVEVGDEPWNYGAGYADFGYYQAVAVLNGLNGGDPLEGYSKVATQVHDWCEEELTSLGRGADLIRVFNAQFSGPNTIDSIFSYCNANGRTVDEIAVAPYFGPNPVLEPGLDSTYASLNAGQVVDMIDAFQAFGLNDQAAHLASTLAAIEAGGQETGFSCYEGGLASANAGGSGFDQESQSLAVRYHPGVYGVTLGHLSLVQAAGARVYNWYCVDQLPTSGGDPYETLTFGVYDAYGMTAGIGDGSDRLYSNLPDIAGVPPGAPDLALAVTPLGAAVNFWNASGVTLYLSANPGGVAGLFADLEPFGTVSLASNLAGDGELYAVLGVYPAVFLSASPSGVGGLVAGLSVSMPVDTTATAKAALIADLIAACPGTPCPLRTNYCTTSVYQQAANSAGGAFVPAITVCSSMLPCQSPTCRTFPTPTR